MSTPISRHPRHIRKYVNIKNDLDRNSNQLIRIPTKSEVSNLKGCNAMHLVNMVKLIRA